MNNNEWDCFLAWDRTTPLPAEASKLFGSANVPSQQWRSSTSRSASSTNYDTMIIEDASFDIDGQVVSPLSFEGYAYDSNPAPIRQPSKSFEITANYLANKPQQVTDVEHQGLGSVTMPHQWNKSSAEPTTVQGEVNIGKSNSSPAPKRRTRASKRKSTDIAKLDREGVCQSRKRGHNAIEKRYRTNLNDRIMALKDSIPALSVDALEDRCPNGLDDQDDETETVEKDTALKYGKAAILTRAVEYILHLEGAIQTLGNQVALLTSRSHACEDLLPSSSIAPAKPDVWPDTTSPLDTLGIIRKGMSIRCHIF